MKTRRSVRWLSTVAVLVSCSLPAVTGFAGAPKVEVPVEALSPTAPTAPVPPTDIPLADIAARATEVVNVIGVLTDAAVPSAQVENIAKSLPDLSKKLDEHFDSTKTALQSEPALETLQALQQQWQRLQLGATTSLSTLTQQATKLQVGLNQLAQLQKVWTTTRASAQAAKAPDPIVEQIDATLKTIAAAQTKLQTERAAVLDLQSRVAGEVTKCGTTLALIAQYQQKAVAGIFVPDAAPLWSVELLPDALRALPEHVRKVRSARWADYTRYVSEPHEGLAFHGALFLILALVFLAARQQIRRWKKSGLTVSPGLAVFERPFTAALALAMLFATSPFFQIPNAVRQGLTMIALVPMLRLVRPVTSPVIMPALYVLCLLFAVETSRQAYGGIRVIGQALLVAESLAAIVAMLAMRGRYRHMIAERFASSGLVLFKTVQFLIIIGLIVSFVAGAAGYLRLARLLTPGVLIGGVLALAAYAYLRVVTGFVALAFRVWPLRLLRMVEHHQEHFEKRIYRLLIWLTILGWSARYLAYLGLLDTAWSWGQAALATKLERGTISISIGNIFEFFLAVWLAHILSQFIRFALQEDVYPRIDLAPGMSYAVSSLLNYIILALGFIAGLGLLGVDFSKVGILAGAFGVGIGFGLQSIVNNFVSGLILLFERPIHVGDTVEVGNLQGRVRRIGIRASVIHTGAGADIIVPNSQLVSEKVTNWTLSDRLRRVDFPVGVNYGADPKKVIDLLVTVASADPRVMKKPPPNAFLLGYGESSINFELRVWIDESNSQTEIRSDLATAVYEAVTAAGMSFPYPQREIRLLGERAGSVPKQALAAAGKIGET